MEAADGFLFVAKCETGQVVHVSDSVTPVLNQSQADWYGHSLLELVHPDDIIDLLAIERGNELDLQQTTDVTCHGPVVTQ